MRRASRGRLEVPASWREVGGNGAFMFVGAVVPLERCGWDWGGGCVEGWVGGLGFEGFAVAGGVEMPLAMFSAAGEAIVGGG